jgi:hypothetical protein
MSPIYQASSETLIPLPQGTFLASYQREIIKESRQDSNLCLDFTAAPDYYYSKRGNPCVKGGSMAIDVAGAFRAPMEDQTWMNKILIGGLINIVPIVNFIAMGYSLKYFAGILSTHAKGRLPEWEEWGGLFVIGLKAFVVALVYMIGVVIIGALSVFIGKILGGILALLLFLAVMFLLPVAIVRFVQNEYSIGAAFEFEAVYEMAKSNLNDYIIVYAVIVGAVLLLGVVGSIPVLGWVLAPFAFFYLMLGFYNLLAMVFRTPPGKQAGGEITPAG